MKKEEGGEEEEEEGAKEEGDGGFLNRSPSSIPLDAQVLTAGVPQPPGRLLAAALRSHEGGGAVTGTQQEGEESVIHSAFLLKAPPFIIKDDVLHHQV